VSEDLRAFGLVERAFLGILFTEVDQRFADANQIDNLEGLYLAVVTETGATARAGLRVGDVLLKIDGKPVNTEAEFLEIIGQHRPGETIELTYSRKGVISQAKILLQDSEGKSHPRNVKPWGS
jgi:S1-C subfamily serine protease